MGGVWSISGVRLQTELLKDADGRMSLKVIICCEPDLGWILRSYTSYVLGCMGCTCDSHWCLSVSPHMTQAYKLTQYRSNILVPTWNLWRWLQEYVFWVRRLVSNHIQWNLSALWISRIESLMHFESLSWTSTHNINREFGSWFWWGFGFLQDARLAGHRVAGEGGCGDGDVDRIRYPRIAESTPYEVIQGPDETIFVPSGWYHQVGVCLHNIQSMMLISTFLFRMLLNTIDCVSTRWWMLFEEWFLASIYCRPCIHAEAQSQIHCGACLRIICMIYNIV